MTPTLVQPVTYGMDASIARFRVTQYQKMIEAGILDKQDSVELLEGYVVLKMPKNPRHEGTLDLVKAALEEIIPSGWLLRSQQSIHLSDSQPEPDFAVVRGNKRSFLTRHPEPAEIGLVIEVADASLLRDQRDKSRIYGRSALPCYWIINLPDTTIEVYTQPTADGYEKQHIYQVHESIPLNLEDQEIASIAAKELLP